MLCSCGRSLYRIGQRPTAPRHAAGPWVASLFPASSFGDPQLQFLQNLIGKNFFLIGAVDPATRSDHPVSVLLDLFDHELEGVVDGVNGPLWNTLATWSCPGSGWTLMVPCSGTEAANGMAV